MASTLGLAPNTVRSYCQSLLSKLQSTSRIQALAHARSRGLL
jgi:DNA-binding NarL/FixJ family response regulator